MPQSEYKVRNRFIRAIDFKRTRILVSVNILSPQQAINAHVSSSPFSADTNIR